VVLDTNVRRVLARALSGVEFPSAGVTRAERELADSVLPEDDATAATWSVAVMELGALVCTAGNPACPRCPVADLCAWQVAGSPAYDGPARKVQTYAGTDRQCRGRLLGVVRDSEGAVLAGRLDQAWSEGVQRQRALESLIADGLLVQVAGDPVMYALP
jgi:A/G-specific adenine glycosylase